MCSFTSRPVMTGSPNVVPFIKHLLKDINHFTQRIDWSDFTVADLNQT